MEDFDYVIIGAGSAGCVLADRLSEDGKSTVLVLEYGGSDRSIFIQMPTALSIPMNMPRYNWGYKSEPEPQLNNRRLDAARGKVLGGSSSINGLVYVRGNPLDFERWRDEGAAGWSYAEVLPYFRRAERRGEGGDEYRGDSGKLQTSYGTLANPLHAAWLEAGRQAGYPHSNDLNGRQQEGFGRFDMTVGAGRRCSAARAYLRPAMNRPNLTVRTHALVEGIEFAGRQATGVRFRQGDSTQRVRARRATVEPERPHQRIDADECACARDHNLRKRAGRTRLLDERIEGVDSKCRNGRCVDCDVPTGAAIVGQNGRNELQRRWGRVVGRRRLGYPCIQRDSAGTGRCRRVAVDRGVVQLERHVAIYSHRTTGCRR